MVPVANGEALVQADGGGVDRQSEDGQIPRQDAREYQARKRQAADGEALEMD